MSENSNIEWTTHTFNPFIGCTKVSPGCAHCYAETLMDDRYGKVAWGPNGTRVKTTDAYWRKPLSWEKAAAKSGETVRVFPSLCDPFEDWQGPIADSQGREIYVSDFEPDRYVSIPDGDFLKIEKQNLAAGFYRPVTMADLRRSMFALIDATPHLTWLLLTKRPENIPRMWPGFSPILGISEFRKNVWMGTSIENQGYADSRIPELLKCRDLSPVLWVSYEPAIGPVNFREIDNGPAGRFDCLSPGIGIDWIVVGGESGHEARPFDIAWARSTIKQCRAARVPVFCKQLGTRPREWTKYGPPDGGGQMIPMGLSDPKGGLMEEWPDDLRIRQYPTASEAGILTSARNAERSNVN